MAEAKGQPFSVRFGRSTDLYMEEEARRLRRSKSSIVEELAEEAAKCRRFPGVIFQGGDIVERRAVILGTGFDVWQLVATIRAYGSVDSVVADFPGVEPRHCRIALAYHDAYPEEIDALIGAGNSPLDDLRSLFPFALTTQAPGDVG